MIKEALQRVLGESGNKDSYNICKGTKISGTGEQRQFAGTDNLEYAGRQRNKATDFRRTGEQVHPGRASLREQAFQAVCPKM